MARATLALIEPFDPVAGTAVAVRAASHDDAALTSLGGEAWTPAIARLPNLGLDLFDGDFSGQVTTAVGGLELDLAAFPSSPRYIWGDCRCRLWHGTLGDASLPLLFDGLASLTRISDGRISLALRVNDLWLDRSLLSASYAGTGGAEGPADLKGTPKPLAIGLPKFCEGVLVDSANSVVQLHGYGGMQSVPVAFDRLVRFPASTGDWSNYSALVSAPIPPGRFATAVAEGLVRHGAPPAGVLSYHVEGDRAGPDGWVRTPGQVIKRLALLAGASVTQIDEASLDALDVSCPRTLSLFLTEQVSAREIIQQIAASCNAVAGVDFLSRLFVARVGLGTPQLTLAADGSALPPVEAVEQREVSAPFWRLAIEAARSWRVHGTQEIAAALDYVDRGTYSGAVTYREGEIVFQPADGRRYWFSATTPAAGIAPPAPGTWSAWQEADPAIALAVSQGDNAVVNAGLTNGSSGWVTSGGARTALGAGSPAQFGWFFGAAGYVDSSASDATLTPLALPANSGTLYTSVWAQRSGAAALEHVVYFYDSAGTFITGDVADATPPATGSWHKTSKARTIPAGAARWVSRLNVASIGGGQSAYFAAARLSSAQEGADVTAEAAPSLALAQTAYQVNFSSAGAVLAGQLPKTVKATRKRGDQDVSASTSWSLEAPASVTAAIASDGLVTITALAASSTLVIVSARSGEPTLKEPLQLTRVDQPAAASGGAGATSASDTTIASVASASYGAAVAGPLTVRAGASGQIACTAPLSFEGASVAPADSNIPAWGKWQWRLPAGSWADIAAEVASSVPAIVINEGGGVYGSGQTGALTVNQTKTGLTSGTDYEFQLLARGDDTRTRFFFGTARAEQV